MDSANELMELERESYRRRVASDFDWMIAVHSENALFLSPGSDIQAAKEILHAAKARASENNSSSKNQKFPFFWEPLEAKVSASEDMGYVYGITKEVKSDGTEEHGKYVSVWVKEEGKWKVTIEIRNTNTSN